MSQQVGPLLFLKQLVTGLSSLRHSAPYVLFKAYQRTLAPRRGSEGLTFGGQGPGELGVVAGQLGGPQGGLGGGPQLAERELLAMVPEGVLLQQADGRGGEGARQALVGTAVFACSGRRERGGGQRPQPGVLEPGLTDRCPGTVLEVSHSHM